MSPSTLRFLSALQGLVLTIVLLVSFALTCLAQTIVMVPVRLHLLNGAMARPQIDEQINFLNRIYTDQKSPFRFHLVSIDTEPKKIGSRNELNVFIDDIFNRCFCLGYSAFPWDAPFEGKDDVIFLDFRVIAGAAPSPLANQSSGVVLAHEVGHWLGLYHDRVIIPGEEPNCMATPPWISADNQQCKLTDTQIYRMRVLYSKFRA